MPNSPIVVWFRLDLRTADHPALTAAAATGRPVIPVYVLDDDTPGRWAIGGASRWWLHHSLQALSADLAALGSPLVLRQGPALKVLTGLAEESGTTEVYCTRAYEPWARQLEHDLHATLAASGGGLRRFPGSLLFEPDRIATGAGTPFQVFTPYWRTACRLPVRRPLPAPQRLQAPRRTVGSETIETWQLLPRKPDWAGGLRATWSPGEHGAADRLQAFLNHGLASYATDRDIPAHQHGTSRLSPHLHFGEISPVTCWHAALAAIGDDNPGAGSRDTFLKEIGWREFSYHLLFHRPDLPEAPFRPEFAAFPWHDDTTVLRRWQQGLTGYPIVDAGMRELWATGTMHNRVRMIAASFLVKHLLLPWQRGAEWFWDCLVDADLASNSASWQWVAGCGADAAPYFRIFNPIVQGRKFDPDGEYVRRWVPELVRLDPDVLHTPWLATPLVLAAAGIELGSTYPEPIVEHSHARQRALAAYDEVKAAKRPG